MYGLCVFLPTFSDRKNGLAHHLQLTFYMFLKEYVFYLLCLLFCLAACDNDESIALPSCEDTMFGLPAELTGLDTSVCKPYCLCKNFWSKDFTTEQLTSLRAWQLSQPFAELIGNPYETIVPDTGSMVCAMIVEDLTNKIYRLESFSDETAAVQAGGILTHHDACGLCSTLTDFAVYAEDRDVGTAVRNCLLNNFLAPFDTVVACLQTIGFTKPCAQIWAYNGRHTQANCLNVCLADTLYHQLDGSLSACLQCDEDISGPIFKAVAGRTRRNTGLASSICRPCEEVQPVAHDYPF